jgi:bile acid:Na+ symporter, BASS family
MRPGLQSGRAMTVDLLVGVIVPVAVILMMTAVGLNLSLSSVRSVFRHPRSLVLMTLAQLVLLPVVALALIVLLTPPPLVALAIFAVAISPGGALSNGLTHLVGGNLALSVMMTIATTMLVAVTAPAAAGLATASGLLALEGLHSLSAVTIAYDLARVALLPICLGLLCTRFLPDVAARIRPAFDRLCIVAVVTVLVCSAIVSLPVMQESVAGLLAYAAALSIALLTAGALASALLPREDRSASIIEFGVRNLPIALLLASGSSPSTEIVAFLLCYLLVNTALLAGFTFLSRSVRLRPA